MDDLISRQEVIDLLKQMRKDGNMVPWEGKDVFARIRKLPPAQLSTNLAKVGTDLISRAQAIAMCRKPCMRNADCSDFEMGIMMLPSAQPEPLTDKEQRIFLAAIGRERKVCKEVDDQFVHEPYEVLLTKVCDEIERKVKKALWT